MEKNTSDSTEILKPFQENRSFLKSEILPSLGHE